MSTLESRCYQGGLEVREGRGGRKTLIGYAAVFNSPSADLGGFTEVIRPGAFNSVLNNSDVLCLREHNPCLLLGRQSNATLTLTEDAKGIRYECLLPDTSLGRDTSELVRAGYLKGSSFTFRVAEGGETWQRQAGKPVRFITAISKVGDVGPVTTPAYPDTSVALRAMPRHLAGEPDLWQLELQLLELELSGF